MQDWIETKDDYLDTPNPRLPDREHFAVLLTNLGNIELPDFVAMDKDGRAILVAQVIGHPHNFKDANSRKYALLRLIDVLKFATKNLIPFAMLVDRENIEFFRWDGHNLSKPILSLNTADVLSHYSPKFKEKKEIYKTYLTGFTESWLHDLASHWNSETPPHNKEIEEIGFLKLIKDGTTRTYY
jgi:hypothetical protein